MQPPEFAPGGGQGGGMRTWQKVALGCGGLLVLGVLLAVVLIVGIAIGTSGGEQASQQDPAPQNAEPNPDSPIEEPPAEEPVPAEPEEGTETVTVRVIGTEGMAFTGDVGSLDGSRSVEGAVPQEYEVQIQTGEFDFDSVYAFFSRDFMDESEGTLGVQIVYDGEVVEEGETSAQAGSVSVNWSPNE